MLHRLIFGYLKFVYITSRWHFIWPEGYSKNEFISDKSIVFAFWHNRLAFGPGVFLEKQNVRALISPHSDGAIISKIVENFGFKVISGSTNKDSVISLKQIIKHLKEGGSIAITPDGPRGPRYKINSSITEVAKKYATRLIPISCQASRFFTLNSWDGLIIPIPFSQITVIFGHPVQLSEDKNKNDQNLEESLNHLKN